MWWEGGSDRLGRIGGIEREKLSEKQGWGSREGAVEERVYMTFLFHLLSSELLNVNWKKPDREMKAPNVCRLIRRTNEVRVCTCVHEYVHARTK